MEFAHQNKRETAICGSYRSLGCAGTGCVVISAAGAVAVDVVADCGGRSFSSEAGRVVMCCGLGSFDLDRLSSSRVGRDGS